MSDTESDNSNDGDSLQKIVLGRDKVTKGYTRPILPRCGKHLPQNIVRERLVFTVPFQNNEYVSFSFFIDEIIKKFLKLRIKREVLYMLQTEKIWVL